MLTAKPNKPISSTFRPHSPKCNTSFSKARVARCSSCTCAPSAGKLEKKVDAEDGTVEDEAVEEVVEAVADVVNQSPPAVEEAEEIGSGEEVPLLTEGESSKADDEVEEKPEEEEAEELAPEQGEEEGTHTTRVAVKCACATIH